MSRLEDRRAALNSMRAEQAGRTVEAIQLASNEPTGPATMLKGPAQGRVVKPAPNGAGFIMGTGFAAKPILKL